MKIGYIEVIILAAVFWFSVDFFESMNQAENIDRELTQP